MKFLQCLIAPILTVVIALCIFTYQDADAQRRNHEKEPQPPIPPGAHAEFCQNAVVPIEQKEAAFLAMQAEGCQDMKFVELVDGYWLAFGTKVVIDPSEK